MSTIIYGSGEAAKQISLLLHKSKYINFTGVIDDKSANKSNINLPQIDFERLSDLCKNSKVEQIIVAIPSLTPLSRAKILDKLSKLNVQVFILPSKSELQRDNLFLNDLREINTSDLIGRSNVISFDLICNKKFKNKSVLVTGGGGSIGSKICEQLISLGIKELIIFDNSEYNLFTIFEKLRDKNLNVVPYLGDLTNYSDLNLLFTKYSPNIIFHSAAYKHVEMLEMNILKAWNNNVLGTINLLESLEKNNSVENFTLISSDKAVRPTNFMGVTKRICELLMHAQFNNRVTFKSVRFGNVIGSSGSVIPIFEKQISRGGPVTVRHPDVERYFMTIEEASKLVIEVTAKFENNGIFILNMGEPIKIKELAEKLISMRGMKSGKDGIEIVYTGLRSGEKLYEELLTNNKGFKYLDKKIFLDTEKLSLKKNFFDELKNLSQIEEILKFCEKHVGYKKKLN